MFKTKMVRKFLSLITKSHNNPVDRSPIIAPITDEKFEIPFNNKAYIGENLEFIKTPVSPTS